MMSSYKNEGNKFGFHMYINHNLEKHALNFTVMIISDTASSGCTFSFKLKLSFILPGLLRWNYGEGTQLHARSTPKKEGVPNTEEGGKIGNKINGKTKL
jgi:hypothetical protein